MFFSHTDPISHIAPPPKKKIFDFYLFQLNQPKLNLWDSVRLSLTLHHLHILHAGSANPPYRKGPEHSMFVIISSQSFYHRHCQQALCAVH